MLAPEFLLLLASSCADSSAEMGDGPGTGSSGADEGGVWWWYTSFAIQRAAQERRGARVIGGERQRVGLALRSWRRHHMSVAVVGAWRAAYARLAEVERHEGRGRERTRARRVACLCICPGLRWLTR